MASAGDGTQRSMEFVIRERCHRVKDSRWVNVMVMELSVVLMCQFRGNPKRVVKPDTRNRDIKHRAILWTLGMVLLFQVVIEQTTSLG